MTRALVAPVLGPAPRPRPGLWWARTARHLAVPAEHSLVAVCSDRFPPGTPVDLSALDARGRRPSGWLVDLRYRARDGAVVRLDVAPGLTELPPWFSVTYHPGAAIPAVTLAAHVDPAVPSGSVLVSWSRPPAGLLRWQLRSGLVEAFSVEPGPSATGLDRLLPVAAQALAVLRGWPAVHGDERAGRPAGRSGVERLVGDLPARLV